MARKKKEQVIRTFVEVEAKVSGKEGEPDRIAVWRLRRWFIDARGNQPDPSYRSRWLEAGDTLVAMGLRAWLNDDGDRTSLTVIEELPDREVRAEATLPPASCRPTVSFELVQ